MACPYPSVQIMPAFIHQLDDKVISQIAAGEVIEGPFAVVKELVENSLDAGALSITIAVEAGGKNLIRISDDGMGMSGEDLQLSCKRHTTSKILTAADLQNVATLGFRGEALASIASVARLEILTRQMGELTGWRLFIEGTAEKDFSPAGCAEGTVISIKDLFYNTPARKKFLKSDIREADKCYSMFRALALSRPNVEWKYYQEDKLKIHLPRAGLWERMGDIFGKQFMEGLEAVDYEEAGYRISGFISDKSHPRRTREYQYLYLNGRRIADRKLAYSVAGAYENFVQPGSFPCYALFLEIDPQKVDVNVHPAKAEVRFQRENEVFAVVRSAVKSALGVESIVRFDSRRPAGFPPSFPGRQMAISVADYGALFEKPPSDAAVVDFPAQTVNAPVSDVYTIPNVLFQLENKYIVTQVKSGLALFDQHASHERILFEQALNSLTSGKAASQGLLLPLQLDISVGEEESFEELLPQMLKLGFEIASFGPRTYLIEAVPAGVKISNEVRLIREMLEFFRENDERWIDAAEKTAAAFACKAAIKTGDVLSPEEMITLIEGLFRTGTPHCCPHGRPTYIRIEIGELDRRFGRG